MAQSSTTEQLLMARAARSYYVEDRSKTDIAEELGVSRFRVARLIDSAKRAGIVKIDIQSPSGINTDLSIALQRHLGLSYAVVVDMTDDHPDILRSRLGQVAAEVLREIVDEHDVLGVAWARSLRGIGRHVKSIAPVPVVQLTGALSGPDGSDIIDLVRQVASAGGGTPHVFYAPLVAPDAASARVVRRQPEVARALELAERVTVAIVGIGAWNPGLSTIFDMVEPEVRERARSLGTVGEISGAMINADGSAVTSPLSRRIIGVTPERLEAIKQVISVAYGVNKSQAVAAAVIGGLVNGLITHSTLAQALLDGPGLLTP